MKRVVGATMVALLCFPASSAVADGPTRQVQIAFPLPSQGTVIYRGTFAAALWTKFEPVQSTTSNVVVPIDGNADLVVTFTRNGPVGAAFGSIDTTFSFPSSIPSAKLGPTKASGPLSQTIGGVGFSTEFNSANLSGPDPRLVISGSFFGANAEEVDGTVEVFNAATLASEFEIHGTFRLFRADQ
jgi:hypothetical protein